MKTAITELFSIRHPIIQGGMHYVGFAERLIRGRLAGFLDAAATAPGRPVGTASTPITTRTQASPEQDGGLFRLRTAG